MDPRSSESAHRRLEERFQAALRRARHHHQARAQAPAPRYDEVYFRGLAWLDSLASTDALEPPDEPASDLAP